MEMIARAYRILVVDDDRAVREWLCEVLREAGHQVCSARNGQEARIQHNKQPFEAIVTDLVMPDEEGIEMIRTLRRETPDVKIVAISGAFNESSSTILRGAELCGADASLTKPLSEEILLHTIRELLGDPKS